MLKSQMLSMIGTQSDLARMVGLTRASVHQWPEQLTQRQSDELVGAALRTKSMSFRKIVHYFPEYAGDI